LKRILFYYFFRRAKDAEAALVGKALSDETFAAATQAMAKQFTLPDNVPGGRAEYRCALTISFL
jgi:xanthine dehydrogenase iron-sulfur cluster and FAD-binding subunit A